MLFLEFLTLLLSMYRNFSLAENSDRKTLFTVRSVTLGEGVVTPSRGDVGERMRLGEDDLWSSCWTGDKESGDMLVGVSGAESC